MRIAIIDMGGTTTQLALWNPKAQIVERSSFPTKAESITVKQWREKIFAHLGNWEFSTISIAVPSAVVNGTISPPNLKHKSWKDCELASEIKKLEENKPILITNDGDCGGLWAHYDYFRDEAKEFSSIYRAAGTGLGGTIVHSGKILAGHNGITSEPGHQQIPYNDLLRKYLGDYAYCISHWEGRKVEEVACLAGLKLALKTLISVAVEHPFQSEFRGTSIDNAAFQIRGLANKNNQEAKSLIAFQLKVLGRELANSSMHLPPNTFILGGGLFDERETSKEFVSWAVGVLRDQYKIDCKPEAVDIPIVVTKAGDDAQLLGAAQMAMNFLN